MVAGPRQVTFMPARSRASLSAAPGSDDASQIGDGCTDGVAEPDSAVVGQSSQFSDASLNLGNADDPQLTLDIQEDHMNPLERARTLRAMPPEESLKGD